jgi:hypothetical protein
MKLRNVFLQTCSVVLLISCASAQTSTGDASPSLQWQPGVVIEKVAKNSEAEKAGVEAGDILLNWVRADVKGQIVSPFDLAGIEIEEEPRVLLLLKRANGEASSYDVVLETAEGRQLWQKKNLDVRSASNGGTAVRVEISPRLLKPGDYVLRLLRSPAGVKEEIGVYSFRVARS